MSTPYGSTGSSEPPQRGQEPGSPGYVGTPSGGFPAQDPHWGYQQGYPAPGYPRQGHPPPGYGQQPGQQPPAGYGQPGYAPPGPGYGPPGYDQPVPGYEQQGYPPPGYEPWQQPFYGQPGYQDYGPEYRQHYPPDYDPPHTGGYGPAGAAPQDRSATPWMLIGLGGVALALIIFLGFVQPGFFTTTVFDQNAVQEGVRRILTDEYGQNAQQVSCPTGQKVEAGARFTCQATIDGAQRDVTITVKTDAGEYEVARPS